MNADVAWAIGRTGKKATPWKFYPPHLDKLMKLPAEMRGGWLCQEKD